MALTPEEQRQLLIDLTSGRISQQEYNSIIQYQKFRDIRKQNNLSVPPLTEAEKRLFQRANSGTNTTATPSQDEPEIDAIDTTTRSAGITNQFGIPPQDEPETKITVTDTDGGRPDDFVPDEDEQAYLDSISPVTGSGSGSGGPKATKYNLLGQPGPEGETNPDAPEAGPYIYDNPPGDGVNLGLDAQGNPITEAPETGGGGGGDGTDTGSGAADDPESFVNSQIWEYNGEKNVVWQVPNTMIFMRYIASDEELDMLYSGRQRPDVVQATDEMWTSSVYFGNVRELDEKVITSGMSPFFGFVDNFDKATIGRPWLKNDDQMFKLWVEGYVEDRDITTEEWSNTDWWNNSTKEERDWLVASKGRGIGDADFPADAKRTLEQNRISYLNTMKAAGIANADKIRDANGNSLAEWFADKVTFGEFDDVKALEQIEALSDTTSGIQVDERISTWLSGKGEVDQTRTGYAAARSLAQEWLGPVYGSLDEATLETYAGIIRNAENPDVGADLLREELKAQRKVLFSSDIYDENLTYRQIAAPWKSYSFGFLGETVDETSQNWLNVLLTNDKTNADRELTAYGLNNNIEKVIDDMSDNIAASVGVSETGVQRGFST